MDRLPQTQNRSFNPEPTATELRAAAAVAVGSGLNDRWRPLTFSLALWLVLSAIATAASDARFLEGLRQRRLFVLAESYCVERLSASDLSSALRQELTIELSRCYAEHALHAEPEQQEQLWAKAIEITEEFARREPANPRLPVVRLQSGLVALARAEWLRGQAELAADGIAGLDSVRVEASAAIKRFKDLDAELSEALIRRNRSPQARPEELSAEELRWLQHNARYRWARALVNLGQTWPPGSADRTDALKQTHALLEPLAQMESAEPLTWQARIDEVKTLRLLQDYQAARGRLIDLAGKQPPDDLGWEVRQEALRLAADQRQFDQAMQLVSQAASGNGTMPAEWDMAELELYLAASRAAEEAHDQSGVTKWQSRAEELVRTMESRHGPYWTRRAHSLLGRSVAAGSGVENLAILTRAAESYFRGGQLDQAIAAYDRAHQKAASDQKSREAFDLAYTAATIEHERQNLDAAKTRYRELALANPQHERAAEAHLLAIYDAGQAARSRSPILLDEYTALIAEHLTHWPVGASASQASFWLARVHEADRAWEDAIARYAAVALGHTSYAEAQAAITRCYDRWIAESQAAGKPTDPLIAAATRHFESLVRRGGRLPVRWSQEQRDAALAAARFHLRNPRQGASAAEELLSAGLKDAADAPAEWKTPAQGLLICALAAQGRHDRAAEALHQISSGSTQETLTLVIDLARVAESVAPELRPQLARVELQAASKLDERRSELSPDEQRRLDLARAKAMLAAGENRQAVELLQQLAAAHSRDGEIQESLAMALLAGADRESLEAALAKWRDVERGSRPGSDRWYRAKYHLALVNERLGNRSQAAKIINLTKVLHPELGGPELKAKFLELLARCQ